MTAKTRYFSFGAASFLVLGLVGGLAAYYGVPVIGALSGEPNELLDVPDDAAMVAFANVREIMDSDVRQHVRQMLAPGSGAASDNAERRVQEETGINIETDVDHVVAYVVPAAVRDSQGDAVVLARGRFDQARIEQVISRHGGTAETYQGTRILVTRLDNSREPQGALSQPKGGEYSEIAVAFVQRELVAIGTGSAIRRSIDLEHGRGSNITANDEFMNVVRDTDEGNAWAVGRFDRLADQVRLPENLLRNLPPITYFAASAQLDGGVSAKLRVETRDAQAAQNLRDLIRGVIALGRLRAGAWPELQAVLQSLQLQADDKTVVLSFVLPSSALQALAQHRLDRRGQ